MPARHCVLALLLILLPPSLLAEDAADVFDRFKDASGGARWDQVRTLQITGTLSAGGLSGEFRATYDLLTGRYGSQYTLGPVTGADGYDGHTGWTRDPGGEVATLDAPEALRRARTQAWLDARAYWYPQRIPASYTTPQTHEEGGKRYSVVVATPVDGDPITLWFDADSNLLTRTIQRQGADTFTTTLEDYRNVDGLRLPFHLVVDVTDSAGRTDPRRRTEVRLERVTVNVPVADADFSPPAMTATARIDDARGITRIPFELINNHIYVEGSVDGRPVRFLVDTGGLNLLTPTAARKLGLKSEGQLAVTGVGDERVDVGFARASEVRVGAAVLSNPVFYIIDLGDLDRVEGLSLDGLVGYEMFRRFRVQIDYARGVLTLAEPAKFVPPAGATVIPFQLSERIPIITGKLDGLDVRFSVDTGSRTSLTLHSPFVRQHNLVERYGAAPESVVGWGVGGPSRGWPVRFGTLQLGDLSIEGLAGDLFTGDKGSFASPDVSGNIGSGALRRFTVAFDYDARRMYLVPNAEFGKPDAFDRSGLWIMADGDALEVADVAAGSAAERAGLAVGDRIVAIGGAAVSTRTLSEWRRRLREEPAGTRLSIRFERAGDVREVTLVLADRVPPTAPLSPHPN